MATMRTGKIGIGDARRQPQVAVENGEPQPRDRIGVGDAERHGERQNSSRQQYVK